MANGFLEKVISEAKENFTTASKLIRGATKDEYIELMGAMHDGKEFFSELASKSSSLESYNVLFKELEKKYLPEIRMDLVRNLMEMQKALEDVPEGKRTRKMHQEASIVKQLLQKMQQIGMKNITLDQATRLNEGFQKLNGPGKQDSFLRELQGALNIEVKRGEEFKPADSIPITPAPEPISVAAPTETKNEGFRKRFEAANPFIKKAKISKLPISELEGSVGGPPKRPPPPVPARPEMSRTLMLNMMELRKEQERREAEKRAKGSRPPIPPRPNQK